MPDEPDFQLLLETESPIELASVESLLTAGEVPYVVQGENHHRASGGLFGNPSIAPRVLVRRDHLERAKELLAAPPATELSDGVCAVHEQPATARCSRCNSFLCVQCRISDSLCESCAAGEFELHEQGLEGGRLARKFVAGLMLAPFVLGFGALVVVVVLRLLGVLPLRH